MVRATWGAVHQRAPLPSTELIPPCSLAASTQAFLGVLQLLQKGNPLSLMQQYGELYRLLAADGYASWLDYLLDQASGATQSVCSQLVACSRTVLQLGLAAPSGCESWLCPALRARVTLSVVFGPQPTPRSYRQVIKATDNPLARAAAAGKPTQHLHAAAAHDLDQLQQLAVTEKTLASWVKDTAFGLSGEWLDAATSLAPAAPEQQPESVHKQLLAVAEPPPTLAAPLSTAQRAGLRAELASKWRWSEGVEVRMSRLAVLVVLCSCFRAVSRCGCTPPMRP